MKRLLILALYALSLIATANAADNKTLATDTLWGAYCYRSFNDYPSGSTRRETPLEFLNADTLEAAASPRHRRRTAPKVQMKKGEKLVYYVLADPCKASLSLVLSGKQKAKVAISLTMTEMNNCSIVAAKTVSKTFNKASLGMQMLKGVQLPSRSWYLIEISADNWAALNSVDYLLIDHNSVAPIKPSPIFMAPSVHLNGWQSTDPEAPEGEAYDWAYMEVMFPKQYEIRNTYVMSLGILSGYMGIQTIDEEFNRDFRHRVLFSMWDKGDTDKDHLLPDYLRSSSLDWASDVQINRFGGEGTGTQAIIYDAPWQCDNWVQFIATCRPECLRLTVKNADGQDTVIEHNSTLVTAWYKEAHETEWRYLATHRESGHNHYIRGWYSFLENFTDEGGDTYRRAYYRNGFLHSLSDNRWYQRNKVGFGHTQGKPHEPRYDYGHGATGLYPNCFYLEQGGYSLEANDSLEVLPLTDDHTPVDTIDLNALWQRMEQAIARENTRAIDLRIANAAEQADKLAAFKTLAKEYIDNVGHFGYYAEQDLQDLRTVWHDGLTTDAAELALFLRQLTMFGKPLKYGVVERAEHLGIEHAYQIRNAEGQTLAARGGSLATCSDNIATDNSRNWRFVRQGNKTDLYFIYNIATREYLATEGGLHLSHEPVAVMVKGEKQVISIDGTPFTLIDNYFVEPDYSASRAY